MIYEILVRATGNQQVASDNLIWIESSLPTRSFEKWLLDRQLLVPGAQSPVARWRIVQSQRPAHFVLKNQPEAIEQRIAELVNPAKRTKKSQRAQVLPQFAMPSFSIAT